MNKRNFLFFISVLTGLIYSQYIMAGNGDKPGKKAVSLKADLQKSSIEWFAKKVTGEHNGTVKLSNGGLDVEAGKLKGGSFEIDMTSITVVDLTDADYNAKLTNHLKSDDFFSVEKNPKAVFKITKAAPIGHAKTGENNYTITGDLTIKGITNSLTFPAKVNISGSQADATAKFDIDRTKYDVKFRSGKFFENLGDKMIYDNFTIDLKLVAGDQI
jgi:polyisoprenoid-binding protein YceI